MNTIESIIFRSVLEYNEILPIFFQTLKKDYFSKEGRVFYEFLQEKYLNGIRCEFNYILNIVPDSINMLDIAAQMPTNDISPYMELLTQKYYLYQQKQIAQKIIESSKNKSIVNISELLDSMDTPTTADKNLAYHLDYLLSNKIRIHKEPTRIDFLDGILQGGLELGQLILISGEYETGKTSLGMQIMENLSISNKTVCYYFEFTIEKYCLQRVLKIKENLAMRGMSEADFSNMKNNMIITSNHSDIDALAHNICMHVNAGFKFFFIDSQMVLEVSEGKNQEEEETRKFHVLHTLAQKFKIVIFLIIQTSKNDIKTPLGTKKGGHYANIIFRLEHVKMSKKDKEVSDALNFSSEYDPNFRELIVQKNKQTGIRNKLRLNFNTENQTFSSDFVYESPPQKKEFKSSIDITELPLL